MLRFNLEGVLDWTQPRSNNLTREPLNRDHLSSMTNNNNDSNGDSRSTTIVITTHYIEEARQAHRQGKRIRRISDQNSVGSTHYSY